MSNRQKRMRIRTKKAILLGWLIKYNGFFLFNAGFDFGVRSFMVGQFYNLQ